jgi:hypothetical protein
MVNYRFGCLTKNKTLARCRWFKLAILATQEAEIRKTNAQSQPGQTVCNTLSQNTPSQNKETNKKTQ